MTIPLHRPLLKCHKLFGLGLITPDQVLWASSCHIQRCSQNHGWNKSPCPWGCESHPRSHGQHVTIAQPHATCTTLLVLKYFQSFLIPISTSIPIHCLILLC